MLFPLLEDNTHVATCKLGRGDKLEGKLAQSRAQEQRCRCTAKAAPSGFGIRGMFRTTVQQQHYQVPGLQKLL